MSENSWYFRQMREEDITAAEAIERMVFSRPWSRQAFLGAMQQDTFFVVALDGGIVAGYCGMYVSFEEGEITNVAVKPEYQGQGIGRAMMEYFLAQVWQRGIGRIVLEVRISNERAIHLYRSLGFQNCGIRKNFYELPREDGMVMALCCP